MLLNLLRVAVPTVSGYSSERHRPEAPTSHRLSGDQAPAEISPLSVLPEKVKPADDLSPNLETFEQQKQRDCQADAVDGYRLPLQWIRLHHSECKGVFKRLNAHLATTLSDNESRKLRAHAVARYVSFFCGISLKKCLRLPLYRKGSMFLDIRQGVIRRDQLVIAPRMDRKDRRRVHGRWWRTRLPMEVTQVLRVLWTLYPDARTLGELLKAEGLDYTECQSLFNAGWETSHAPEDTRFAMSLRGCLLELGIHPALVARITGDTMTTPASDFYYLSFTEAEIHEAISIFCVWAGLTPPSAPIRNRQIGSPKALLPENFKAMLNELNQFVRKARNSITPKSSLEDVMAFHNLYAIAVALQLIWGVGGRGDRVRSLTFERIFSSEYFMAFSDRRVDRYSRQRIVPSTSVLSATRKHYLEHLLSFGERLKRAGDSGAEYIAQTLSGKRLHTCAFSIFEKTETGWVPRELQHSDLLDLAKKLGASDLNIARHFWFTALVRAQTSQVAIEALLGHHINGAEAFGFASGISVQEVCTYLQPILNSIQRDLGFEPLIGCGRTAQRFLVLPELSARSSLYALPNLLLKGKLDVQDFLIREIPIYEQDPPSNSKTLVAHSQLIRLKRSYLTCDAVRKYPAGGLIFCLVAMAVVLTETELKALFYAALGSGLVVINTLGVLEANNGERPVVQRLVNKHVVLAAHMNAERHKSHPVSWEIGQTELHRLLTELDPTWPAKSPADSSKFLARLTSHWAAIEIPPGTLFGALHKAPFIPAADIARLYFKKPCIEMEKTSSKASVTSGRTRGDFEEILTIVSHWGDKDIPSGEELGRHNGCIDALRVYEETHPIDEWQKLLVQLLRADLSPNPPYRTLSPTTLPEYARGYARFIEAAKSVGTPELDPETLLTLYIEMGGSRDFQNSCAARWHMLHICAFLNRLGYRVPLGFLEGKGRKTPALARIPVYTSHQECETARSKLHRTFGKKGGTYAFAGCRLDLQRAIPLRISEVRYAKPQDFDCKNKLFHITSTGHNHLKSSHSRGTCLLGNSLAEELTGLQRQRTDLESGSHTLLFADMHLKSPYAAFDAVSAAIKGALVAITGRAAFREHDLRAAATTDVACDVGQTIDLLCNGLAPFAAKMTALQITEKHRRFAHAARLARHASSLTTLRYYICSSMLDLGRHCLQAEHDLAVTGSYVSAVIGKNSQSIYAANHRARKDTSGDIKAAPQTLEAALNLSYLKVLKEFSTVQLGELPSLDTEPAEDRHIDAKVFQAVLLMTLGLQLETAGHATEAPTALVESTVNAVMRRASELKVNVALGGEASLPSSVFTKGRGSLLSAIQKYAEWVARDRAILHRAGISLCGALDKSGSKLLVRSDKQLLDLLPVLQSIRKCGLQPVFRPGSGVTMTQFPELEVALSDSAIPIHFSNTELQCFGTVGFLLQGDSLDRKGGTARFTVPRLKSKDISPGQASPRSYGMAGRLALTGLVLGLSTQIVTQEATT